MITILDIAHHTVTRSLWRGLWWISLGLTPLQLRMFCLLTQPEIWNCASSLKKGVVVRQPFDQVLTCLYSINPVLLCKFLNNNHLVRMEVEVLVKNSTNRTIWDAKGRHMFACGAPGRLQNGPSESLDVLWCSRGPWSSSSFFGHTSRSPEVLSPQQNGFSVRYSVPRGDLLASMERTLHRYDRVTLRKVGFDGKWALLVGPHYLYDWGGL